MRFWGYVLLIMGIAFLLLFVFALFGGAHLGVFPFIIAAMLVVTGVNLIKKGQGILRAEPAATELASITPGSQSAATPAAVTVSLPLSPQVAAVIAAQSARNWKLVKYLCAGIFLLFVGMGAVFAIFMKGEGDSRLFLGIFGGIGVASAAMIAGISWLTTRRPVLREPARADLPANHRANPASLHAGRGHAAAGRPGVPDERQGGNGSAQPNQGRKSGLQPAWARNSGSLGRAGTERVYGTGV